MIIIKDFRVMGGKKTPLVQILPEQKFKNPRKRVL